MAEHSRIGASSASRWFECPGSVELSKQAPPQESSIFAEQGTAAAWVIESVVKSGTLITAYDFVGKEAPNGCEITTEDAEAITKFLQVLSEDMRGGQYILHSEAKFSLEKIYPGLFGTSDIVLMESNMKRLKVYDYKHGAGVPVQVENNKQLMYYALGAIQFVADKHEIDYLDMLGWGKTFKEVEVVIAQPRCRHKDGIIRRWVVPADVLDAFAVELKKRAEDTAKPNPTFKTGTHCRWCPAMSICKAFNNQVMEIAQADFKAVSHPTNLTLPSPDQLSKPEIVKILDFADLIVDFLKRVESQALYMMEHGDALPGYKLVKKKANRDWKNVGEAIDTLSIYVDREDLYTKKPVSPAQAEKVFKAGKAGVEGKKIVEDLCFKPDNGNTLAPEHDPREAVNGSAVSDFVKQENADVAFLT